MTALDDREKWVAAQAPGRYEDVAGRQAGGPFSEFDLLGRKQPRRRGIPDFLLMILHWDRERVRRVPASAIAEEAEEESLVSCPCGAHPVAGPALARCPGCERWYVHIELGAVYVAYGNMPPPPLKREPEPPRSVA